MNKVIGMMAFFCFFGFWGTPALALSEDEAAHLLRRTQFSFAPQEVEALLPLTRRQAAELLVRKQVRAARTPGRKWLPFLDQLESKVRSGGRKTDLADIKKELDSLAASLADDRMNSEERFKKSLREASRKEAGARQLLGRISNRVLGADLKAWWWEEILSTDSQLNEKLVLFWHDHFPADIKKVRDLGALQDQNELFRREGMGSYRTLLHAVAKHPAMLVYLDGAKSRKVHPNENFARELMELFTLGEGNYSERDIREAARAFTGWSLIPASRQFVFRPRWHDGGSKTVLGRTGNFSGEEVVDLLLDRPETARFITRKLWREFVSPDVESSRARIEQLAAGFRASAYDISRLLVEMLGSDEFHAPENRGALIKSPVHLVASLVRSFGLETARVFPLIQASRNMGQDLYMPPNVKGWPGHEQWITTHTLSVRKGFIDRVFQGEDVKVPGVQRRYGPEAWIAQYGPDAAASRKRLVRHLMAVPWDAPAESDPARFLERLVAAPEYQIH